MNGTKTNVKEREKSTKESVSGVRIFKGTIYIYFKISNNNIIVIISLLFRVLPYNTNVCGNEEENEKRNSRSSEMD